MVPQIPADTNFGQEPRKSAQQWRPGVAAVLSLLIPGSGQLYSGKTIAGLVWLPAVICCYLTYPAMGAAAHGICIYDATEHKTDRDFLEEAPQVQISKNGTYVFGAMIFVITLIALGSIVSR